MSRCKICEEEMLASDESSVCLSCWDDVHGIDCWEDYEDLDDENI